MPRWGKQKSFNEPTRRAPSWKKVVNTANNIRIECDVRRRRARSEKRSSAEVGKILGCCKAVVNRWLARFEAEGVAGLKTRACRGRKPKLSVQNAKHLQRVKREIVKNPQSVKTVAAKLAADLNLEMRPDTLKRFLKNGCRFCRTRTGLRSRQVVEERAAKEQQL